MARNLNKSGGIGCRQVVMHIYNVNPVDASAAQQTCLNIAAAHPFMVLDSGVLTEVGASDCLPAHQVPVASTYLTEEQLSQYHPFYLQIGDIPEDIVYNGVLGLHQLGYFKASHGFRKIGVLYHTCSSALVNAERKALAAAGVPGSKIVNYSLGCPASGTDTPAAMEQAVLNFKSVGVSDVMMLEIIDGGLFTQIAQQQGYKPQYLYAENDAATDVTTGANAPNATNFNGAVDVLEEPTESSPRLAMCHPAAPRSAMPFMRQQASLRSTRRRLAIPAWCATTCGSCKLCSPMPRPSMPATFRKT